MFKDVETIMQHFQQIIQMLSKHVVTKEGVTSFKILLIPCYLFNKRRNLFKINILVSTESVRGIFRLIP